MSETNDQTSTAPMTAEMKARNYAELVYALADCQSGGLTQPYDREGLIALAVWLNDEVAPALAAAEQNVVRLAATRAGIVQLQEENVALTERLARAEAAAKRWEFWKLARPFVKPAKGGGVMLCFSNWPPPVCRGYHEVIASTIDEAMDAALREAAGGEHG